MDEQRELPADTDAATFRKAIDRVLDGRFRERARFLPHDMAEPRDRLAMEVENARS
jgi:hypothetical protein